ncbi:hypothetical protein OJ912_11475, partial [Streptococcus anginosus]|nr:hypothetical protein [Streptococcus anginosus]
DLFSFMDTEEQKEPVSQVMMTAKPVNAIEEKVPESIEMETDSEVADVVETIPTVDFHFPEDLTDFYPKTARDKVETNIA